MSQFVFAQMNFVENKGQWHENVMYKGDFTSGSFFLEKQGFSVLMHNSSDLEKITEVVHGKNVSSSEKIVLHSFIYRVNFLNASGNQIILPEKSLKNYNNYFLGSDKTKWAGGCRIFQAVTYKNVYPNIDIRYYSEGDKMKYDFIIKPGGKPSDIMLRYTGPQEIKTDNKELVIKTSVGDVRELYPYSYQSSPEGKRNEVYCRYQVKNNVVSFNVSNFDSSQILIIDPAIIFASFTGSAADNWGYTATPGPDGSFFAGGIAFDNGYLTSTGSYQSTFAGGVMEGQLRGHDIAIFKFSPNGADRLYATYLGGAGNEQPHSMIADNQGNLIVAGRSSSGNFPTTTPLIGPGGNNDIVITKFNASGTDIIGSVRIGGTNNDGVNIRSKYEDPNGEDRLRRYYGDDARSEVILDANGNIILTSCTQSNNFPVTGNSLNTNAAFGGGFQDGLVLKFSSNLSSYMYGSYFGGTGDDACFVADINPLNGNIFVAGGTTSNNLPGDKSGVVYNTYKGGETDGFVAQIKSDFSTILKTTYIGTSGVDLVYGLKFDRSGFPYIMGTSTGTWPVINAIFSNPGSAQFIAKMKPDFSSFVYSTVFGTGSSLPNLSPVGFMVDRCENVYFSGWGGGINSAYYHTGNTTGLSEVNPLPGIPAADGEDFYFFVLERDARSQLFGSHFGQSGGLGDHVDGGTSRFDENGVIYQAMCANCNGGAVFPTTPGVWRRTNGSANCNEAAVKIEMDFSGVAAEIRSSINAIPYDTAGCVPLRVDFSDTLQKGKKLYWNFGNGQKDTTIAPQFSTFTTYNSPGVYRVSVISEDSTTCNIRDTAYLNIKAGNNLATLDFNAVKDLPCTNLSYTFTNRSVPTSGNFINQSFTWDFGDGSLPITSINATHTFPAIGDYVITLKLNDDNFCNSPDEKKINLRVNPLLEAKFVTSPVGCVPYQATFLNQSGTADVTWLFSDGTRTNTENPVKTFNTPGTYTVRLIARDPNTCNKIDTSDFYDIIVSEKPLANFSWQPNPPVSNTPTSFFNLTSGAIRYLWNFGDGTNSTEVNPTHQYISAGEFDAQLIAYNQYDCPDTVTLKIRSLIDPLLDVPNAFTPNRNGENAIVSVKGFGIGKMDWKIYNRWGQLVFQSNTISQGWDGIFKGKLQPMDVYTYTLDVEFTDGRKYRKTGDITLIR